MTRQSLAIAFKKRAGQAGQFVSSRPDWFLERVSELNSTNFRIFCTLVAVEATAFRYLLARVLFGDQWVPSKEWLGFLAVMSGLDWGVFHSERATDSNLARAKRGDPATRPTQSEPS